MKGFDCLERDGLSGKVEREHHRILTLGRMGKERARVDVGGILQMRRYVYEHESENGGGSDGCLKQ